MHILWVGLLMGGVTLLTQAWALDHDAAHWQSMVFTVLTLPQHGLLSNRSLLFVLIGTFMLQMATLYVPVLNPIFRTQPLTPAELAACLAVSSLVFWGVEAEKWLMRSGWLYRTSR